MCLCVVFFKHACLCHYSVFGSSIWTLGKHVSAAPEARKQQQINNKRNANANRCDTMKASHNSLLSLRQRPSDISSTSIRHSSHFLPLTALPSSLRPWPPDDFLHLSDISLLRYSVSCVSNSLGARGAVSVSCWADSFSFGVQAGFRVVFWAFDRKTSNL